MAMCRRSSMRGDGVQLCIGDAGGVYSMTDSGGDGVQLSIGEGVAEEVS